MTLWIVLLLANTPVSVLFGKAVFDDWDGFVECVKYWLMPDIISWFNGEGVDDWWAELKLWWWVAGCAVVVVGKWYALTTWVL